MGERVEAPAARARRPIRASAARDQGGNVIVLNPVTAGGSSRTSGWDSLTTAEYVRVDAWRDDPVAMQEANQAREAERQADRRLWAALMLTSDLDVCRSILLGRPVLARQLDAEALRRALRGGPLPDPAAYVRVRHGHLDGIAEGGAFHSAGGSR